MPRCRNHGLSFLLPSLLLLSTLAPTKGLALPKDPPDLVLGAASASRHRLALGGKSKDDFDLTLDRRARSAFRLDARKARDDFDGKASGKSPFGLSLKKSTIDEQDLSLGKASLSKALPKGRKSAANFRTRRGKFQIRDAFHTKQRSVLRSSPQLSTDKKALDRFDLDLSVTPKNVYHLR